MAENEAVYNPSKILSYQVKVQGHSDLGLEKAWYTVLKPNR